MSSASYVLYILRCKDGSLYTGITNSLERRMNLHTGGRGSKYVAARLPFELVYVEGPFGSKGDALRREFAVKSLSRKAKETLLSKGGEVLLP